MTRDQIASMFETYKELEPNSKVTAVIAYALTAADRSNFKSEEDFSKFVCAEWETKAEKRKQDYIREHGEAPSLFKTFAWGMELMLQHVGGTIER